MWNIEFVGGKIHKIDFKESVKMMGKFRLGCGLVTTTGMISTRHGWHFTRKAATCEHCLKKKDTKPKLEPTDLSNYHTFIED